MTEDEVARGIEEGTENREWLIERGQVPPRRKECTLHETCPLAILPLFRATIVAMRLHHRESTCRLLHYQHRHRHHLLLLLLQVLTTTHPHGHLPPKLSLPNLSHHRHPTQTDLTNLPTFYPCLQPLPIPLHHHPLFPPPPTHPSPPSTCPLPLLPHQIHLAQNPPPKPLSSTKYKPADAFAKSLSQRRTTRVKRRRR